ncbi:MAG TPA: VWA domain-containing protein [Acidimicrobiales bacterium]|nr:VWA domain-containing protein [Acidimicrobiales bacterium]
MTGLLPFSAIVGQDDAKLALLLNAVDPRIGGVLLRGQKGSAKSTLARGIAELLPGSAPFVELPVGATEDRVVGTIHLAAALTGGEKRFDPGLLAMADGGVLYVDEVNLLPDHLVDVLLDVAASGVNRVEREGISQTHPSRFLLVGSMNPEEGDLRPQLLDRFGLAVDVRASDDPALRAEAVRRRLEFDSEPAALLSRFSGEQSDLAERLAASCPAALPQELLSRVSALCASVGAEGLRADLTICRASAALAGWERRPEATADDVRRVAPMALAHRARRDPLEPAGLDRDRLEDAMSEHLGEDGDDGSEPEGEQRPPQNGEPRQGLIPLPQRSDRRPSPGVAGGGTKARAVRGRVIGDRVPPGPISSVAVGATVRAAATRRASAPLLEGSLVAAEDVREAVREHSQSHLVVVAVDASGSMGAPERVDAARSAVLGLLVDAYQRRDLVSLVAFRGDRAEVLLRPTSSVEVARARLQSLPTGGRTPLHAGLTRALEIAKTKAPTHRPLVVVITDGRATSGPDGTDPVEAAARAADSIRRAGVDSVIVDVEGAGGAPRLGLARQLADRIGAQHVRAGNLTGETVRIVVQERTSATE